MGFAAFLSSKKKNPCGVFPKLFYFSVKRAYMVHMYLYAVDTVLYK